MDVIQPFSLEDIRAAWKPLWTRVIDRTVVPLFVSYDKQQVGVGTIEPQTYSTTAPLVVSGDIYCTGGVSASSLNLASETPTSSADTIGNTGDISYDANYIYVKTTGGWKRSALSTW